MAEIEEEQNRAKDGHAQTLTLWTELEQATAEEKPAEADLWASIEQRIDPSLKEPRQAANVVVASQKSSRGEAYYVLNNPQANTYLRIDARDYFLWEKMDGEHTIRDLAVAYFAEFQAFPFERLVQFLGQLQRHQLLSDRSVDLFGEVQERTAAHTLACRLQRFADRATQREFSLKNADGFYEKLYLRGGRLLFTRAARLVYALVIVAGLAFFVWELETGRHSLFSTAGSFGLGVVVLMVLNYGMTFFHESGHALTCKHYGRRVPKGGLLLYMGSPAFFVDTTDIWMAPRRARILVSLAGPFTTVVLGSIFAVAVGLLPSLAWADVLFKAALIGYVSALLNMNPLLELDGYFVLTDWLEMPRLRKRSLAFMRRELPAKLFKDWSRASREEKTLAIFGILAAVWTVLALLLAMYIWEKQIASIVEELLSGGDVLSLIVVGGLMLLAGANLVLGLSVKALLFVGDAAARARRLVRTRRSRMS